MIADLLPADGFDPWLWLAFGITLLALEAMVAGIFLLWFACGAMATAVILWISPLSLSSQIGVFSLLSIVLLLGGRPILSRILLTRAAPSVPLNRRSESLIGQQAVLLADLAQGYGRVRVADGEWSVNCPTAPHLTAGAVVVIERVDGNTLLVHPLPEQA